MQMQLQKFSIRCIYILPRVWEGWLTILNESGHTMRKTVEHFVCTQYSVTHTKLSLNTDHELSG